MDEDDDDALGYEQARRLRLALAATWTTRGQLWLHYFGLGGNVGEFELDAYLHHSTMLAAVDRDLLAQAANELFDHARQRAPYATDIRDERRCASESTPEPQDKNSLIQDSDVMDHDEPETPDD